MEYDFVNFILDMSIIFVLKFQKYSWKVSAHIIKMDKDRNSWKCFFYSRKSWSVFSLDNLNCKFL